MRRSTAIQKQHSQLNKLSLNNLIRHSTKPVSVADVSLPCLTLTPETTKLNIEARQGKYRPALERCLRAKKNARNLPENVQFREVSGVSAFQGNEPADRKVEHIFRRWQICLVCQSISRMTGQSFLTTEVAEPTTSCAADASTTASRAFAPQLFNARTIYPKGGKNHETEHKLHTA